MGTTQKDTSTLRWAGERPPSSMRARLCQATSHVSPHRAPLVHRLPKPLSRKLKYYRSFLATRELRLEGVFAPTSIDGRRDLHARMAWSELALESGSNDDSTSEAELRLPPGMSLFDAAAYEYELSTNQRVDGAQDGGSTAPLME